MEYTIKREDWREGVQRTQINIKLRKIREIGFDLDIIYCFFLTELVENCDDDLIDKVVELTDAGTDDGFSFKEYGKWWPIFIEDYCLVWLIYLSSKSSHRF